MSILATNRIGLGRRASSKEDAIRQAGALLVTSNCVAPEYINGMLARERGMSTYLGGGVAIPHGEYENRAHVFATGISVLQLPEGVEWESGELARLVIGIAAVGDEHVDVLSQLAEVIEDEASLERLMSTTDPAEVIRLLSGEAVAG